MIEIINKKFTIPDIELNLGVSGEHLVTQRQIKLAKRQNNIDLSGYECYIKTENAKKESNLKELPSSVSGDNIIVTWNVDKMDLSCSGFLYAQLLFTTANNSVIWQSNIARFTVDNALMADSERQLEPSILEQIIQNKYETEAIVASAENRINTALTKAETAINNSMSMQFELQKLKEEAETAKQESVEQTELCAVATDNANTVISELEHELQSNYVKAVHKDVEGSYITVLDSQNGDARETVIEGKSEQRLDGVNCGDFGFGLVSVGGMTHDVVNKKITVEEYLPSAYISGSIDTLSPVKDKLVTFNFTLTYKSTHPMQYRVNCRNTVDSGVPQADSGYFDLPQTGEAFKTIEVQITTPNDGFVRNKLYHFLRAKSESVGCVFYYNIVTVTVDNITTPSPDLPIPVKGVANEGKIDILSTGKNLLYNSDFKNWALGNGVIMQNSNYGGFVLKVKPTTTYTVSSDMSFQNRLQICFHDNYPIIGSKTNIYNSSNSNPYTFTTKSSTKYIFVYCTNDLKSFPKNNWILQLEEGTTATPYELFGSTQTVEIAPLYSLPNGIKDNFYLERGEIERNVGKVVFDGNYNPIINKGSETYPTGVVRYNITIDGSLKTGISYSSVYIYSDKFKGGNYHNYTNNSQTAFESISKHAINNWCVCLIKPDRLEENTINGFKKFMNDNRVEILYPLAQPVIEKVPPTYIPIYESYTNIYTTDAVQPNIKFKYPVSLLSLVKDINVLKDTISQLQTVTTRLMLNN